MAKGLVIRETMSGWLRLDGEEKQREFAFSIRAFTSRMFSFSAPREFRGTAMLDGIECPCRGELTLQLKGPHYWLEFDHPELGRLFIEGSKKYTLGGEGLLHSLVTCPMQVYRDDEFAGVAEVAYRDSMLAFPFTALRLADEREAFGKYGEQQ